MPRAHCGPCDCCSLGSGASKRSPCCSPSCGRGLGAVEAAEQAALREAAGGEHPPHRGPRGADGAPSANVTKSKTRPPPRRATRGSAATGVAGSRGAHGPTRDHFFLDGETRSVATRPDASETAAPEELAKRWRPTCCALGFKDVHRARVSQHRHGGRGAARPRPLAPGQPSPRRSHDKPRRQSRSRRAASVSPRAIVCSRCRNETPLTGSANTETRLIVREPGGPRSERGPCPGLQRAAPFLPPHVAAPPPHVERGTGTSPSSGKDVGSGALGPRPRPCLTLTLSLETCSLSTVTWASGSRRDSL